MKRVKLKYLATSVNSNLTLKNVNDFDKYEVFGASGLVGKLPTYASNKEYLGIVKDGAGIGRINEYPAFSSLLGTMSYIYPQKNINRKWLKYAINSLNLEQSVDKTTIPHIYFSEYGERYLFVPDINQQQKIADFLDEKVKEIDNAIEKTKETIDLYKKYKQAIITEAVTKGLDPNAKMKDSGIDWVKEIPSQWKKIRIKHLFELRNERNYAPLKSVNLLSLYSDIGVIQHDDIEENAISGNKAINADGYKIVYAGDIVDNIILCWMGAIGMSEYNGVTSPAYDVYKPIDETVFTKYFHYLFRTKTFGQKCYTLGRGIMRMRWRVYSEQFMSIYVPVPSFEEQKKIVNFIEAKEKNINNMIEAKEYEITKLQSYKQSLIYEYVTGKKEVK